MPLIVAAACLLGTPLFWIPLPYGLSNGLILVCLYLGRSVISNFFGSGWVPLDGIAAAGWVLGLVTSLIVAVFYGMTIGVFLYVVAVIQWVRARTLVRDAERYIQRMEAEGAGATA